MFLALAFIGIAIYYLLIMFSIFFHELGHLTGYKIATRGSDWIIHLGTGKILFSIRHLRLHAFPIYGMFLCETTLKNKKEQLLMYAGGPIFTAILIILLFVLQINLPRYVPNGNVNYIDIIVWIRNVNLFMMLFSLIPMKYHNFFVGVEVSDGLGILRALRKK